MTMPPRNESKMRQRRGAVMILVAVLMPVFCLMAAFAIDVAWMQLARTELRTATDAAARAGAKTLSLEQDIAAARAAARDAALRNQVAGAGLATQDRDIQFGLSEENGAGRYVFSQGGSPINAVHVNGLRTAG